MIHVTTRAVIIYFCVAVSLGFVDHRVRREQYRAHVISEYIPSVLAGTSGAPAKYRVLMPHALDYVTRTTGWDGYTLFLFTEVFFIFLALVMTHAYLARWFAPGAAVGGTLALAAFLPLTFTNSWAHPDTFPDLFLFTAGCFAVATRRDLLLAAILFVGLFNRETMGFLVILWALERWPEWRNRRTRVSAVLIFGISAAVYVGLRVALGFEHYEMWMVPRNLSYVSVLPPGFDPYTRIFGFFWILLVAVPAWIAWEGTRIPGAPRIFFNSLLTGLCLSVIAWLFAAVVETRVFTPVLPLLLPGAVAAFSRGVLNRPDGRG